MYEMIHSPFHLSILQICIASYTVMIKIIKDCKIIYRKNESSVCFSLYSSIAIFGGLANFGDGILYQFQGKYITFLSIIGGI